MPRTLPVESRNQWFQRIEALKRSRKKRRRHGEFVVEGVRSLDQLSARDEWEIEALLYAPARSPSRWAEEMLRSSRASVHLELSSSLMEELSEKEEASELLAVVKVPDDDPARLRECSDPLYVLIDRPTLPGNLGTLVRSCDGLGADGVIVFGRAADLYDPRTIRSAAGSLFVQPTVRMTTWGSLGAWLDGLRARMPGLRLVATTAREGVWPEDVDLCGPTVLMLGNETAGLSYKLTELCDTSVSIPMTGSASSLNVACAATAVLYEAARQRCRMKKLS